MSSSAICTKLMLIENSCLSFFITTTCAVSSNLSKNRADDWVADRTSSLLVFFFKTVENYNEFICFNALVLCKELQMAAQRKGQSFFSFRFSTTETPWDTFYFYKNIKISWKMKVLRGWPDHSRSNLALKLPSYGNIKKIESIVKCTESADLF